jgi:hypothetical protein
MEEYEAPYLFEAALLAGEEFDALALIALHRYYRQALGCLRNALEVLTVGTGLAVTDDATLFARWRDGYEVKFGNARNMLRDSTEGRRVDLLAAPAAIFQSASARLMARPACQWLHGRLCGYAHSRAGFNNMDFWESNGPVQVWGVLDRIIAETRESMVLGMVLLSLGWPGFAMTPEAREAVANVSASWQDMAPVVNVLLLDPA